MANALVAAMASYKGRPDEMNRKNQAFGDGPLNYWKPPPSPPKRLAPPPSSGVYHGGSRPRPIPSPQASPKPGRRRRGEAAA